MPTRFELDRSQRIVHSRAWDRLTDAEMLDHQAGIAKLFQNGTLDATWAQIFDFGAVTEVSVSTDIVVRLSNENPWPVECVRVIITPGTLLFGLSRMFQLRGNSKTQNVHVIRNAAEAPATLNKARVQLTPSA